MWLCYLSCKPGPCNHCPFEGQKCGPRKLNWSLLELFCIPEITQWQSVPRFFPPQPYVTHLTQPNKWGCVSEWAVRTNLKSIHPTATILWHWQSSLSMATHPPASFPSSPIAASFLSSPWLKFLFTSRCNHTLRHLFQNQCLHLWIVIYLKLDTCLPVSFMVISLLSRLFIVLYVFTSISSPSSLILSIATCSEKPFSPSDYPNGHMASILLRKIRRKWSVKITF